jgi:uncharacterized membrane protein
MQCKNLVTILICDVIFVFVSIPLILRKVPRNVLYGFRTRTTLKNDFIWYEANACFGRLFLIGSLLSAFMMLFIYFSDIVPAQHFINAGIAVLIIPAIAATVLTFLYIQSIK